MKAPKIARWVLSPHAAARMEERKISTAELETVLMDPFKAIVQGPKWILAARLTHRSDNLIAAVVLEKEDIDLWLVVTVMVRFEVKR